MNNTLTWFHVLTSKTPHVFVPFIVKCSVNGWHSLSHAFSLIPSWIHPIVLIPPLLHRDRSCFILQGPPYCSWNVQPQSMWPELSALSTLDPSFPSVIPSSLGFLDTFSLSPPGWLLHGDLPRSSSFLRHLNKPRTPCFLHLDLPGDNTQTRGFIYHRPSGKARMFILAGVSPLNPDCQSYCLLGLFTWRPERHF